MGRGGEGREGEKCGCVGGLVLVDSVTIRLAYHTSFIFEGSKGQNQEESTRKGFFLSA